MAHPVASADCVAWYRGDSLVDGGGGVASSWQDKSGNGHHLSPTSGPTIVDSGLNSRLAARLVRASSQFFSRASTPSLSPPYTYAVIAKAGTLAADAYYAMLASNNTSLAVFYYQRSGSSYVCGFYNGGSLTAPIVPGEWVLHIVVVDSSGKLQFNNHQADSGSLSGDGPIGLRIGTNSASDGGTQYWNGDVAEAVVWDKALDDSEIAALYDYFVDYYYPSLALHPVAPEACIAWYRGDSLVDGGGGVASAWEDKTPNRFHAVDVNGPTIGADAPNGRLAAQFVQASDQYFTRGVTPEIAQPFTVAVVGKVTTLNGNPNILASAAPGGSVYFDDGDDSLRLYAGAAVGAAYTFGGWDLFVGIYDGAGSELYLNGSLHASGNPGSGAYTGIRIAKSGFGDGPFQGYVAEVVVWNKVLDSGELDDLYADFQSYYFAAPGAARSFGAIMG